MSDSLKEEVLASQNVFQGRLLTIRVDKVRLPDGVEATREVVAHPGAVAMVPVVDENHVILVRQWRHAAGQALLEIPAGTLAKGEEPQACAERELMEEIGYRPRTLTHLYTAYLAPGYSSERIYIYLAEGLVPEKRAHDEDERLEIVTLTWDEVNTMRQRGELGDAKTLCGLLLAQQLLQNRK